MNAIRTYALTLLLVSGCAGPGLFASEPMGKQLERALDEIKKDCIERGAPPFGENRPGRFDTSCLMFTLKPWEPGDTPESAFAHSIKLPPPHDKPKDVYKPGMSSEAYFKALCEAEAGEWVFRRVEGVKGIRQDRPTAPRRFGEYRIVFYATEPTSIPVGTPKYVFDLAEGRRYQFFERRIGSADGSKRGGDYEYFDSNNREGQVVKTPKSNYAYLSRGVRRTADREHAIEGMEFIVFQSEPFEVLGFRRNFSQFYLDGKTEDRRTPWARGCANGGGGSNAFLYQVLSPARVQ